MSGNFLDKVDYNDEKEIIIADKGTVKCFYDSTSYGDGCFEFGISGRQYLIKDNTKSFGHKLPIDAGLIGIISAEILDYYDIDLPKGMILCEFTHDFIVNANDGEFDFGQLVNVETGYEDEGYDYI